MALNPDTRLRGSFAEKLQKQAGELASLAVDAQRDRAVRDALRNELDRIRSTADSLGVDVVGRAARAALDACDRGHAVDAVRQLVEACRSLRGLETVFRPVILLGSDPPESTEFATVLRHATTVEQAIEQAREDEPCAFLVQYQLLRDLIQRTEGRDRTVPIYAIGPGGDLQKRIRSAHLGAFGYLAEPLDMAAALTRVRAHSGEVDPPPYRVLVVEPDEAQGRTAEEALNAADCKVRWVREPDEMLATMDDFWPELIVLASTHTGDAPGLDLAAVIHGHERFAEIPILFLADAEEVETTGFVASADDILIKPVPRGILRARVRGRVLRARIAHRKAQVDMLTGCLNRGPLLRAADREVGVAKRDGASLAVVLADLDGIRALNTARGLAAGDRALRAFAMVFRKNFRETDVIGRIGSDSFALLMPKCKAADAEKRVTEIRTAFREWAASNDLAGLDFSSGIADTTTGLADVLARADLALLEARRAGGGRSVLDGA